MRTALRQAPGAAILDAGEVGGWCESGPVRDVTIRDNDFIACNYNRPHWGQAVLQFVTEARAVDKRSTPYHRNITISGNRFACVDDAVLRTRSVANLHMHDNILWRTDGRPLGEWVRSEASSGIDTTGNQLRTTPPPGWSQDTMRAHVQ